MSNINIESTIGSTDYFGMDGTSPDTHLSFTQPNEYKIDPDKVKSIEDIVLFINAVMSVYETFHDFDKIKHFLKQVE